MRQYFLEMLKQKAYRKGKFTLSSGKESEHYVNCKPVTLNGEGLSIVSEMMRECIDSDTVAVGGLTLGADPLVCGVAIAADIDALIVRKESKGYGTNAWIEGPLPPKGSKVTVLEDVITTGGSAIKEATKLRDAGYVVERVVAIVNRQEGNEADALMESAGLELYSLYVLEELIDV